MLMVMRAHTVPMTIECTILGLFQFAVYQTNFVAECEINCENYLMTGFVLVYHEATVV